MSLRFPPTQHSWQASFKTYSFAQPFTQGLARRKKLLTSYQRRDISKSAQGLAQRKAGTQQTPTRATPRPSQIPSRSRKPAAYEPFTDKLAIRASPTLLYQASSYIDYLFACYAVGGSLFAAALFNFRTQFYVRPGVVPRWVPVFTSFGSILIACAGCWMILKVRRIARHVFPLQY